MLWTIPKMWPDSTVVVLGGGPSLADVDLTRLNGHRVIAVNNAYELGPWEVMFFGDPIWYRWAHNRVGLSDFCGLKITSNIEHENEPGIKVVRRGIRGQLSDDPSLITWGVNSGLAAITLAYQFGARRVLLLGFDFRFVDGKANYHDEHKREIRSTLFEDRFHVQFKQLAPQLEKKGVEVINCTPESALDVFPIMPLEDVL